ncbi:response regulator transcription factor [Streptomyces sp. NPDC059092]|uniref:response regulator transcription factor n=1 Tax=Streptomyces sp. NPDC059092 TaxID=3346725 RepID=UPI0036C81D07
MQVLLVEDDVSIAEPLVEGLARYGFTVQWVCTGDAALDAPRGDMVLLDLGLPDMDGIDVCRALRQDSDVPIIMLTARGTEADRVVGLELGADDYLAKPFSLRELVARIRAVTRRSRMTAPARHAIPAGHRAGHGAAHGAGYGAAHGAGYGAAHSAVPTAAVPVGAAQARRPALVTAMPEGPGARRAADASAQIIGDIRIDRRTRQVHVAGRPVTLAPKEFDVLALLAEDPGAVCSRQQILGTVWDPNFFGPTKTLDVHIAALRRKLGDPRRIETLRCVGFRLTVSPGYEARADKVS